MNDVLSFRSPTAQTARDLFNEHNETEKAQRFLSPVSEQDLWYERPAPYHASSLHGSKLTELEVTRFWWIRGQVPAQAW